MSDNLVIGRRYDLDAICAHFRGWQRTGRPCSGEDLQGYTVLAYFRDGQYLGPDLDGIEPIIYDAADCEARS